MRDRIAWRAVVLFVGVHVAAVAGAIAYGFSWHGVALAGGLYVVRMFAITGGTHRYFAHRSYRTSRAMQLVLALVATTSSQQGVLWWASQHRAHHQHADEAADPHARHRGFWWSHLGWFLVHTYDATEWSRMRDFAAYRELRWLDRFYIVPIVGLIGVLALAGGLPAVVWGYCVSTVVLWHATSALTSIAHWLGSQRYATGDESRNSAALALITLGDGWHNNHHFYPGSARHGFYWWELDLTYLGLRALAAVGLIWDLRVVPEHVRARHVEDPACAARSLV